MSMVSSGVASSSGSGRIVLRRVGESKSWPSALNPWAMAAQLLRDRSLIWQFARREMTARHRGSMLGMLWLLLQPLVQLGVYTFVFALIWEVRWPGQQPSAPTTGGVSDGMTFAVTLFCGLVVFDILAASVNGAVSLVTSNPNYVKKVVFPLEVLPAARVTATTVLSGGGLLVLMGANLALRGEFSTTAWLFPLVLVPLVMMTAGLTLLVSSLGVFLQDLSVIVSMAVQVLFYLTPILYPSEKLEQLPEWLSGPLAYNPLTPIFEGARSTLVFGSHPDYAGLGMSSVAGGVCLLAGYAVFTKAKRGFADVL
jgi:lipopolysaccharide transport system permease protein